MKLLIDECIAPRSARLLVQALELRKPPIVARLLEDWIKAISESDPGSLITAKGSLDRDWARALKEEGGWVVITADSGRTKGAAVRTKGPPLHLILPALGVTGVFLEGRIAGESGFEKLRSIYYTFPEIVAAFEAAPGSRFRIRKHGTGYRFEDWPLGLKDELPEL